MTDRLGPFILGPTDNENQGVYTGDARILSQAIPDESVDLIFTDPIYQNVDDYRWLAETAIRVLKPGGDVLVYLAHYHLDQIIIAMNEYLDYRWLLVEKKLSSGSLIWSYRLFSHYIPLLWYSKGSPRGGASRLDFLWSLPLGLEVNHAWSKNRCRIEYWLGKFSGLDDIVFDPFCGGGAVLAACKTTNRSWLAFEIDSDTAEAARQRIRQTQPPLFALEPQQVAMPF